MDASSLLSVFMNMHKMLNEKKEMDKKREDKEDRLIRLSYPDHTLSVFLLAFLFPISLTGIWDIF